MTVLPFDDDPPPAPEPGDTFTVYGNYGELTVCLITGRVLHYQFDEAEHDKPAYWDIYAFDMRDILDREMKVGEVCDITLLGYWASPWRTTEMRNRHSVDKTYCEKEA